MSYSRISFMLDVNKGTIKDQEKKYQNGNLPDGDFVFLKFGKNLLKDSLRHVIYREFGDYFKTVNGLLFDSKRVNAKPEKNDQYFKDLEQEVSKTHRGWRSGLC